MNTAHPFRSALGSVVTLTAENLAKVRAGDVLAVGHDVWAGGVVELRAEAPPPAEPDGAGVGVMRIDGPLAQRAYDGSLCGYVEGYDAITSRFLAAIGDDRISALVLAIDSPGGDVAGLEAAVDRMRSAKIASGKPVYVYVDEQAASAAYWIASGLADELVVPSAGLVGSIGCIGAFVDRTAQLEAEGLKVTVVRDPEGKAPGAPQGPLPELATERLADRVGAVSRRFAAAVEGFRDIEDARGFNGRELGGRDAVRAGLADRVGTLEETIARAASAGRRAARKRREERMDARMRKALGLSEDASEQDVETTIARLKGVALIGDCAMQLTGADDPDQVIGRLEAWKGSHERAEEERAELAAQREASERKERIELLAELVRLGYETPATAWANPESATESREPHADHASTPVERLRARVEVFRGAPRADAGVRPRPDDLEGLTPRELAYCQREGLDPAAFAASKTYHAARPRQQHEVN